jgi:uncharacterized membrane protein
MKAKMNRFFSGMGMVAFLVVVITVYVGWYVVHMSSGLVDKKVVPVVVQKTSMQVNALKVEGEMSVETPLITKPEEPLHEDEAKRLGLTLTAIRKTGISVKQEDKK